MLGITQHEVRRHPRWREELRTPMQTTVQRPAGSRLLTVVAVFIVVTALLVVLMS